MLLSQSSFVLVIPGHVLGLKKKTDSAVSVSPPWRRTSKGSNMFVYNCILPIIEPPRDKTNNVAVRPAKTQISLGIRPV